MDLSVSDLEMLKDKLMEMKVTAWRQRVISYVEEEIEELREEEGEVKKTMNEDLAYRMKRYYEGEGER